MEAVQHEMNGAGNGAAETGATIRDVLRRSARLPIDVDSLADDADLFEAGMSSHASVSVMLGLEDAFDIEFPDSMLKRSVFESVQSIAAELQELAVRSG
jgi:acyl carrier protein